jgi:hypothetical protein
MLLANDHLFKRWWGGPVTGKLSDIAGLALVPLLLLAFVEIALASVRRQWQVGARTAVACATLTALAFACVKLSPTIASGYGDILGVMRAPFLGAVRRVAVAHDLSDLFALPAVGLACLELSLTDRESRA